MARTKEKAARGSVGKEIFASIQKLVADEKIGVTEAFKRFAAKTGRHEGTVAANYYRVARLQGVSGKRGRRSGIPAKTPAAGKGRARSGASRIEAVLRELATAVRAQEAELNRLRTENARLDAIRKFLRGA